MTLQTPFIAAACVLAAGLTGACSTQGAGQSDQSRAEAADAVLADYRPTGETQSCVSLRTLDEIEPLDDRRWLITMDGGQTYLNEVSRGCSNAANGFTYLQYSTSTGRLCRNEIVQVRDRSTNVARGSCGLGEFQTLESVESGA